MKTKRIISLIIVTIISWFVIAHFMVIGIDPIKFWDIPSGAEKFWIGYLIFLMSCLPGAVILLAGYIKNKRENMGSW